jgi:hypothetical protein
MTCNEFLSMLAFDPGHPDIIYPPHFDNALGREVMQIAHADARLRDCTKAIEFIDKSYSDLAEQVRTYLVL